MKNLNWFLFLVSFSLAVESNEKFDLCNLNSDDGVDRKELTHCLKLPLATDIESSIESIFNLFDADKTNRLERSEFNLFIKISEDHERDIDVVTHDGQKKTMKQGEFLKLEEDQRKGFQYENGQVSKVHEGESTLSEIQQENPELSRFITIGRWAHKEIVKLGYATGNITGIRSLNISETTQNNESESESNNDDDNDKNGENDKNGRVEVEESDDYFETRIELLMKESAKAKSKNVTFQLWIVWDPVHYLTPSLAIKSLVRIDTKKSGKVIRTELPCPSPKIRQYQTLYRVTRLFVQYSNFILLGGFVALILLLFVYFFVESKEPSEENKNEGEGEGEGEEENRGDQQTENNKKTKKEKKSGKHKQS